MVENPTPDFGGMNVGRPIPPSDTDAQNAIIHKAQNELQEKGFILTQVDSLMDWARTGSMWPMTFGLACCARLRQSSPVRTVARYSTHCRFF